MTEQLHRESADEGQGPKMGGHEIRPHQMARLDEMRINEPISSLRFSQTTFAATSTQR